MKKLFAIFLIMLFAVSSSGATLQLHYCCGKLKTISFGSIHEKECGMDGMMGSKPCCETKSISANEQSANQEIYTINLGVNAPVEPMIFNSPASLQTFPAEKEPLPVAQASPPLSKDICILHCVFRI